MGEVWPTAHITELCLQLTAGSRPVNRDEHRALASQSCERALLTSGDSTYYVKQTGRCRWFQGFGLSEDQRQKSVKLTYDGVEYTVGHGVVVIAAITSCTNTSNPSVMLGAGTTTTATAAAAAAAAQWVVE